MSRRVEAIPDQRLRNGALRERQPRETAVERERGFGYGQGMGIHLRLDNVRSVLIRLEETILFALIERAQFLVDAVIYEPGAFGAVLEGLSLVGYNLRETEKVHARMRRYTSPDEHPFFSNLPPPILPALRYPDNPLHPNTVNVNDRIRAAYEGEIVPRICGEGDDAQYGSSSTADVACLQALSRRIHYGKFVAETKCRAGPGDFDPLIRNGDAAGLMRLITDEKVESEVLRRVRIKAETYSAEVNQASSRRPRFNAIEAVEVFRRWVIPMNKDVQVAYLLQRTRQTGGFA